MEHEIDYELYGPEWKKEMLKWNKQALVERIADLQQKNKDRPACHCSWGNVTGGVKAYYCGRCGKPMPR